MNRPGAEVNGRVIRIGLDIGGSKIAAIALDQRGRELARLRRDVPRDYPGTLAALVELTEELRRGRGPARSIGIGMPRPDRRRRRADPGGQPAPGWSAGRCKRTCRRRRAAR